MESATPFPQSTGRPPVFPISCWLLGLVAFSQVLVAGMALAARYDDSRQIRTIVKEVPKIVAVRVPATKPAEDEGSPVVSRPPAPREMASFPMPAPTPVTAPKVDDPRSERLIKEARQARVAGDMVVAVMKLEEALTQSPEDPTVHYEMGLVHEQMGVFDTAAAHYVKVIDLGASKAGALFELAGNKLRDGFEQPEAALGKLSLGRVRIFKDPDDEAGQRVVVTIPVQKAPGEEIDNPLDIGVSVLFFNRTSKGEIVPLEPENKSWVTDKWVSLPFDWAGGEETDRMTYVIPSQDARTEHLFGAREYYGQVVTLMYKGTVLDVQAWPRDLAARIAAQPAAAAPGGGEVPPEFQDALPPDMDPDFGVLPPPLPLPSK